MQEARTAIIDAGWWATKVHIPGPRGYERCHVVGTADSKSHKLDHAFSATKSPTSFNVQIGQLVLVGYVS